MNAYPREQLKIKHKQWVSIPTKWKPFLWSYQHKAPLEKLIVAVCRYGKFEDIKQLYQLYPKALEEIALRRPDIPRGIKFWVKRWRNTSQKSN